MVGAMGGEFGGGRIVGCVVGLISFISGSRLAWPTLMVEFVRFVFVDWLSQVNGGCVGRWVGELVKSDPSVGWLGGVCW